MAKKHKFRYATLLRVRQRQEELKALALAEIRREIRITEMQREEILHQQRQMLEEAKTRAKGPFHVDDVRGYYQYERHLARLAVEKDARLIELNALAEKRRQELEEALRARRMIEKISEREVKAFQAAIGKKEQAALDESASNQAAMSRAGEKP
ncbi:MAG: flagellar FliJ family protein [FCB group bacterium]|jgi:flagellar export protein FliJ|nr:flagellar FliJ family protein [FCB group bacterium]